MSEQAGIDLFELARTGKTLEGSVSYAQLPRLADILAGCDEGLRYAIAGSVDPRGRARFRVAVSGRVWVDCRRCLGRFEHVLDLGSVTVLAPSEEVANAIEREDEEAEVLVAHGRYDPIALVEDELLLALPFPPRHDDAQCRFKADGGEAGGPTGRLGAALARELAKK